MQFRYARNWVQAEIIARIPGEKLADEPVLVCFLAGDGKNTPFQIVPLRLARIIRTELVGTSCLFIFEVGAFVSHITDDEVRAAADPAVRPRLPGPVGPDQAFFVFECNSRTPKPSMRPNLEAFERVVNRMSTFPPFDAEDAIFFSLFRVSQLRKYSWFGTWPKPRAPSRLHMGSYVLPSGGRYECEVYCLRPNDPPLGKVATSLKLAIVANDTQLAIVSGAHGAVDSKYDVKRFLFQSEYSILDRLTGIRLFINNELMDTEYRDVAVPIVLKRSFLLGPLKALLIILATAGTAMVAAKAADKLDQVTAVIIMGLAVFAGIAAVFPSVKKP